MAGLTRVTIQAPSKGIDRESASAYVAAQKGQIVQNLLPGFNGRLPIRGALRYSDTMLAPTAGTWAWIHDGGSYVNVLVGTNGTNNQFAQLETATGIVDSATPAASTLVLHPSYDRLGAVTYGIGIVAALGPTVLSWDGTGLIPATRNSSLLSSGPRLAVKTHLDRLFVLMRPTTGNRYNQLSWSDIGGPTTNTDADWKDDATGLFNTILLPADEDCVGLARVGRNLAVLREDSIYMLTGDTPSSFALRRVASVGCRSLQSIVEYNDGVFFQSDRGIEFFDGATVATVSADIRTSLDLQNHDVVMSRLNDDFLSVIGASDWFIYHVPSQSWATLTSSVLTDPPAWTGFTPGFPIAHDGTRLWNLALITSPGAGGPNDSGWNPGYDTNGTTTRIIPARLKTRFQKMSTPAEAAQLHRMMVTHVLDATDNTGVKWTIDINGSADTGKTLAADTGYSQTSVRRNVFDAFSEAIDGVEVDVRLEDTNTTGDQVYAEVQDITLEYQTTSLRSG